MNYHSQVIIHAHALLDMLGITTCHIRIIQIYGYNYVKSVWIVLKVNMESVVLLTVKFQVADLMVALLMVVLIAQLGRSVI
jgi:hypothetical protein